MEELNAETILKPIIAVPNEPVNALDGQGKEREIYTTVVDDNLGEPFTLYKSANAWWMGEKGVQNVLKLMAAFKSKMTVEQACFSIGIPVRTFYYFTEIHPDFLRIKQQLGQGPAAIARASVINELSKNPNLAWRYLQGTEPDEFNKRVFPGMPSGVDTVARRTEEFFLKEGEPVFKKQTLEMMKRYDEEAG